MTEPIYFTDTYLYTYDKSKIVAIRTNDNEESKNNDIIIVLDGTIFHPQGGGQPSDIGVITGSNDTRVIVTKVMKDGNNCILHYGHYENNNKFNVGDIVSLDLDKESRDLHAKFHSAGHLLDVAMELAELRMPSSKGYHFTKGAYVEYIGVIEPHERENALIRLQEQIDTLIEADIPVNVLNVEYDKLIDVCYEMPKYIKKPTSPEDNETIRVIRFGDYNGCPCGGTHVKKSSELMGLKIVKFTKKRDAIRVRYDFSNK